MIAQAEQLGQQLTVSTACQALGVPRSSLYRARQAPATPGSPAKASASLERG
jgi:hypothetical protein